ncbi:hypothetical protein PsYK624_151170 [Phanerochaete sordida]|uniref:Hydrophobin n=1 Tax=Phanerochaete sordida TaxID=48140 RepID=A0A9P3GST1_9APHY|nr:hypothetical protein PsYK624_151170 [Phanerochaete sordida]
MLAPTTLLLLLATAALAQLPAEPTLNARCPRPAAACVDLVETCLGNVVQQVRPPPSRLPLASLPLPPRLLCAALTGAQYNLSTNPACVQAFECLIQGGQLFELVCCSVPDLYFCAKTKGLDYAALMLGAGAGSA